MRCPECGVETAEATSACVVCGAPSSWPSAASAWSGFRAAPGSDVDGARHAEWIEARTFSTVRLRLGYDMAEVDAFLGEIRATFLGIREPPLTPAEIRITQFSTTRLRPGYYYLEVDAVLDEAEGRLAAQAGAWGRAAQPRSVPADPAAGTVPVSCLECGADWIKGTEVCARCGAPAGYQPYSAYPVAAQRTERSGPPWLKITVGIATVLVAGAGLFAHTSRVRTSPPPSTDQLTSYQLRTGDCLQELDQALGVWNDGNGPFTAVPCTQPHAYEVFFAGHSWPRSVAYPGDQGIYDDGLALCSQAFIPYDGIDSSLSAFDVVASTPDSVTWPGGDRWLVCFATTYGGSVNYSIRGSRQ
jgi:DivIVA domain-containing protein